MPSLLISAWNSKSLELLSVLEESSFANIFVCISDPGILSTLGCRVSQKFVPISVEYPLYTAVDDMPSGCMNNSSLDAYAFFAKDMAGLLQADRLSIHSLGITHTFHLAQRVYFYWIHFLEHNDISCCLFPIAPHTFSDYMLLLAARFLKLKGIVCRHSHDCSLLSRLLDLDFNQLDLPIEVAEPLSSYHEGLEVLGLCLYLQPYVKSSLIEVSSLLAGKTSSGAYISQDPLKRQWELDLVTSVCRYREHYRQKRVRSLKGAYVYYMHIEPEMTLNPSSSPLYTQKSALDYIHSILAPSVVYLKEHPHLPSYLEREFHGEYRRFRKYLCRYMNGRHPGFTYLGLQYSNNELLASGIVPISVTGDICIESSLLGLNSVMLTDWWGFKDPELLGIYGSSHIQTINNDNVDDDVYDLVSQRLRILGNHLRQYSSFAQCFYLTERTKRDHGAFAAQIEREACTLIMRALERLVEQ